MRISSRNKTIALWVTVGVCLLGLTLGLNVGWVILNWRKLVPLILGIILFGVLMAGVVLNTTFLVREIRRSEQQNNFINNVTHELKTPIASIRLYLETLQRRPLEESQRQEFYRVMLSDSERLLHTVDQILKAGESGWKRDRTPRFQVDLLALVSECIVIAKDRHHLLPDAIVLDAPAGDGAAASVEVLGNADDLRTAVLNLLDNAVKYSSGKVAITVGLHVENGKKVRLQVSDRGMGIPPAHLKHVFKRFYRVPSRRMLQVKGTGLGLFIVRSIANRHGGSVRASSDGEGKGTTVTMELPRWTEA